MEVWGGESAAGGWWMCGEGMGCVGLAGTVPAAGSEGACTCWEVASGDGGGGGALRRAALGVGALGADAQSVFLFCPLSLTSLPNSPGKVSCLLAFSPSIKS